MTILPARTMDQRVTIVERLRGRLFAGGQKATIVNLDNEVMATVRCVGDCPFSTEVSWGWLAQIASSEGVVEVASEWRIERGRE
jgi:hypothetical protein